MIRHTAPVPRTAVAAALLASVLLLVTAPHGYAGTLAVAMNSTNICFYDSVTTNLIEVFNMATVEPSGSVYCLEYDAANGDLWVGLHNPASNHVHVLRKVEGSWQSVHAFEPIARSGARPDVYDIAVIAGLGSPAVEVWVSHNWRYSYHVSLCKYNGVAPTTLFTTDNITRGFEGLAAGTGSNLWLMSGHSWREPYIRRYDRVTGGSSYTNNQWNSGMGDMGRGGTFRNGYTYSGHADVNSLKVHYWDEDGVSQGEYFNLKFQLVSAKGVNDLEFDENGALYVLSIRTGGEYYPSIAVYRSAEDYEVFKQFLQTDVLNAVSYYTPTVEPPPTGTIVLLE